MRFVLVLLMTLPLAACFVSEKPLIALDEAQFPIATPTTITLQSGMESEAKRYRLERHNNAYELIDLDAKKDGKKVEQLVDRFVVRSIGGDMYLVQRLFGSKLECGTRCEYGLVQIAGKRIAVYQFSSFGGMVLLTADEIARFGLTPTTGGHYKLSSFEKTGALFRYLLERPRPERTYQMP
jgi:hypothetical protein